MIASPRWLARKAGKAASAASTLADYFSGLITTRDRSQSQYSRNMQAITLLPYARGYVMNCAHAVAMAAAQQPLRLYASGTVTIERRGKHRVKRYEPGTKPVPVLTRKAIESGRMGRTKAATWAGVGGNVAEVTDHPILDLLTRPNELQNGESIDYQAFLFAQLVGEMFTLAPGGKNPDSLWPMLPQYTNPMAGDDEVIRGFAYGRERSAVHTYDASEVLHFKYQDHTENPYHGMGPLHWCFQAARLIAENEDFDYEMIDSGNLPLAFVTLDPNHYSTPEAVNDFRKYLENVTRGARGKARSLVGVGLGLVNGMPSSKDLQSLEKLREHKATVRQAFGVSESLLELNSANLASATVGDDQFWGMTVRPLLNRRADHLTETLLPMFGLEPGKFFLAYDDPTLADTRQEAETAQIEISMGALSINEYRESRNLPGIGPDGDIYRINGVPADQAGADPFASFGSFGGSPIALPPGDAPTEQEPEAQPPMQKIEETALNGAQIQQLVAIAERVATGVITRQAGLAIARASFPGAPDDKLTAIFGEIAEDSVTPDEIPGKSRMAVPVVGRLVARKDDNGNCDSDGGQPRWHMDMEANQTVAEGDHADCRERDQVAEDAGFKRRPVLSDRHARPDPYDLRDCSCGLTTKDDDDDDLAAVAVPAKLISAEQAAKQTAVLRSGVGSLRDIVRGFMLDAQRDASAQIGRGAAIDLSALEDDLAAALEPAFAEMYQAGFDLAGLEVGDGTALDPLNVPNAEAVLETQTSLVRQLSRDISDHTAQAIEARVRQGIEEGLSTADIAKGIREDTGFAEYRAERIARTEVSQAANAGKRERYKAAGIERVFWVNAPGASAVHRAIAAMYPDGQDINEPFLKAGQTITAGGESETYKRDIYAPPARPNCRCVLQTRKSDRQAATEGDA